MYVMTYSGQTEKQKIPLKHASYHDSAIPYSSLGVNSPKNVHPTFVNVVSGQPSISDPGGGLVI